METKVIETKLPNVFNKADQNLGFDVNTPQFLKEACEGANGGMYAVCYNIFKGLLVQVAERATELHDPVLDALMIHLNLYEVAPKERYVILGKLAANYDAAINEQKIQTLREARKDATEALDKLNPQKSESIPVPSSVDELEAEIEKYIKEKKMYDLGFVVQSVAKYFTNWQREQMMQSALDGEIGFREGDSIGLNQSELLQLFVSHDDLVRKGLKYGDEVKVIVLKKEA